MTSLRELNIGNWMPDRDGADKADAAECLAPLAALTQLTGLRVAMLHGSAAASLPPLPALRVRISKYPTVLCNVWQTRGRIAKAYLWIGGVPVIQGTMHRQNSVCSCSASAIGTDQSGTAAGAQSDLHRVISGARRSSGPAVSVPGPDAACTGGLSQVGSFCDAK